MNAFISNIYQYHDKFRFYVRCDDNAKGYEFACKKEANKAKARLKNRLKIDGFKVYFGVKGH